eukprot:scaffold206865_cov21-Prasinocladus_malaysianus.AAC.1
MINHFRYGGMITNQLVLFNPGAYTFEAKPSSELLFPAHFCLVVADAESAKSASIFVFRFSDVQSWSLGSHPGLITRQITKNRLSTLDNNLVDI